MSTDREQWFRRMSLRHFIEYGPPVTGGMERAELLAIFENCDRLESALREIVRREARSKYTSIYAAPGEFARVAREALNDA